MKSRFLWVSAMVVTLSLLAQVSHAYKLEYDGSGHNLHWSARNFPVSYKVTSTPPVPLEAFRQIAAQSFGAWQEVTSASITFQSAGITHVKEPAFDGENSIITGEKVSGADVVGQSYIFYSTDDGRILDVDIVLNTSYPWSTDGSPGKMDVQNALTHEIGHLCGLDDLYGKEDSEKTMYGYIDFGEIKKRTLDPDDAAGLAAIYPVGLPEDSGGGGGGGCGTISPTSSPPHSGSVNFLWIFILMAILGARRLFLNTSGK